MNQLVKKVGGVRMDQDWLWVSDRRSRVMGYTTLSNVFENFQNKK